MSRDARKHIAEDTLQILEQGYFVTPTNKTIEIKDLQTQCEANTKVYKPEESDELLRIRTPNLLDVSTKIKVTNQMTLDAVRDLIGEGNEDVLCLNFASAKNPGGGFLGGSQAQEESLARSTGLYKSLLKADAYYETNRNTKSCFYTDYMIYSPNVPIIKDEEGVNIEVRMSCGIITAPAVNAGVVKRRESHRVSEIEAVMKRRIAKVLTIALAHEHQTIVLGAWGCGVFQNNPNEMAKYFREVIEGEFKGEFRTIVFAIYARNERFINPFYAEFGKK